MEWQTVGTVATSSNYIFTPVVTSTLFKLKHIAEGENKSRLKIAIRQAFEDDGSLAFFDYKLINCKNEQDIILFSLPQGLAGRKLAFKRVDNLIDDWTIEIKTLVNDTGNNMPSYPSLPISNLTTSKTTQSTVTVSNNSPTVLSYSNPGKIGTAITNMSNSNLYISIGSTAALDNYDKILGFNEVYESPFNWSGYVYGFSNLPEGEGDSSFAKVKDFFQ